jgi:SAM-dependent methyltransferase
MAVHALKLVEHQSRGDWVGVRDELERHTPGTDPYVIRMWREALAEADGIERPPESDPLVFPYVPISPEHFGLRLSSESRVLDLGCLAGFGLFDFTARRLRQRRPVPRLFGVDVDPAGVALGGALARTWARPGQVAFQRATGEALPHASGAFDLVIARSVLQYLRIQPALEELARVARSGGLIVLQVHRPAYYLYQLVRHVHRPLQAAYYGRALMSGLLFAASGLQPRHRWFSEAAITDDRLLSSCHDLGLKLLWTNDHPARPLALFAKR